MMAMMGSMIHFTSAATSSSSPFSCSQNNLMGNMSDVHNNNPHWSLLPRESPTGRRRRWIMSRITLMRGGGGGSSPPINRSKRKGTRISRGVARGINNDNDANNNSNNAAAVYDHLFHGNRGGGSSIQPSSILSIAILIVTQSINVASAAIVLSGYFGAYVASWIIGKLHKILPTLIAKSSSSTANNNANANHAFLQKYKLTSLASIGILFLHLSGIQSNNLYSRISDASFLILLWTYSHIVNPIMGGMIGCTHVSLGILSTMFDHPKLASVLDSSLDTFRLKILPMYNNVLDENGKVVEEDPYMPPGEGRVPRAPIVTSTPRKKNQQLGTKLANMLGSASILLAFPQYCLGLYLLGSIMVSCWSKSSGGWKTWNGWMQWLSQGMECCASSAATSNYDENGNNLQLLSGSSSDGNGGVDDDAILMTESLLINEEERISSINPWNLSKRLLALYWVMALAKASVAYFLL